MKYKIIQNSVYKTLQMKLLKHYYNTLYVVLIHGLLDQVEQ